MKIGNRKKKRQQYLLDVKVQTQGRVRRRLRWMAAITAAAAVFMLTCYGMYRFVKFAAAKLAFENPRFALAQIVVEDDGGMTSQQVIQFAGVHEGQNLLSLDLDEARRKCGGCYPRNCSFMLRSALPWPACACRPGMQAMRCF